MDPLSSEMCRHPDATRLDLENAVLMQELMAMKVRLERVAAGAALMQELIWGGGGRGKSGCAGTN